MNTLNEAAVIPMAAIPGRLKFHAILSILNQGSIDEANNAKTKTVSNCQHELTSHSIHDAEGRLMHIYVAEGLYSYEVGYHSNTI